MSRPGRLIALRRHDRRRSSASARPTRSRHEYSGRGRPASPGRSAFVGLLVPGRVRVGLPEQPRTRRAALLAAIARDRRRRAAVISVVQLFAGDALAPAVRRARQRGGARALVRAVRGAQPRRRRARRRARPRARGRDGRRGRVARGRSRAARRSGRRCSSGWLTPVEAASTSVPPTPSAASTRRTIAHATVVVLSRAAQSDDDIVLQASTLHESGVRIRTLSLFYEQWLGKLPIGELERVSLLFDIGELHAAGLRAREAPARHRARRCAALVALVVGDAVRAGREPGRQPWPAVLPPAAHRPERRRRSRS